MPDKDDLSREATMRLQNLKSLTLRNTLHLSRFCAEGYREPVDGHFDRRGSMDSSDLVSTSLESVAERGLSSFLQAIAGIAPDEDLQKAGDCWIRALEATDWSSGESSDRFICHVTINALAVTAEFN
jgi:hypothetical protein